jgi:hypothetical protein
MRLHSPLKRVKDYGVSMQKKNSHSPAQGGGALKLAKSGSRPIVGAGGHVIGWTDEEDDADGDADLP